MSCTAPCLGIELTDQSAFLQRGDEWDALLRRSYDNRFFYTAAWLRIWWAHFGGSQARIATRRDSEDGQLLAALPLQVSLDGDQRVLSLLGDPNVTDYMDALAVKPQAVELLEPLWNCVLTHLDWDRVELRHIPSHSPLIVALRGAAQELGLEVIVEDDEVCPVALLCSSWDGYLQMLTKKQRHEVRRKLRRAQEEVQWDWRTAKTEDDLARDLPVFFRLHEASGHDKARFMTHAMRDYFRQMAVEMLEAGTLRLSVFQRDGLDVAASMSFVYRERYLLYNSGYDPEFAVYSPGIAAAVHAMQDAIEEKAIAFDFLTGDESYKYQLGASNTYTCRVIATRM